MFDYSRNRYHVYQATLAFTANAIGSIATDAYRLTDSDFVCTGIFGMHRVANGRAIMMGDDAGDTDIGGHPDIAATILIQETGEDRVLSQFEIDGSLYHVTRARNLPIPRPFKASSTIQVTATLRKTTTSNSTIRLMFEGFHTYR